MSTARDFITLALKESGVLGVGQTALPEDMNDAFTLLNRMMSIWQKKRWLVPSLYEVSAQANGLRSNPIGPGQHYNAARPDKIQKAWFTQTNQAGQNQVSFPLYNIWSYEDYAELPLKDLATWPSNIFYDAAFPYGNVFIYPIPDNTFTIHLVCKSPIGFTIQLEDGEISNAGIGYTNGLYQAVSFQTLTGFGSGGTADVTVAGGVVTNVTVDDGGDGYVINDQLTFNSADIGGTGAGFVWTVTEVTDSLDAEFNMPPEYEEAIHYNLSIRLSAMYGFPVNQVSAGLAKLALNTIKLANTQIPTLKMPSALRFNRNNPFWIYNADNY